MELIKNKKELSATALRQKLLDLLEAGFGNVTPEKLLRKSLLYDKEFNCIKIQNEEHNLFTGRIFAVGGGNISGEMAEEFEKIVDPRQITAGIVNSAKRNWRTKKIRVIKAGYPLSDRAGVKGVCKMLDLKKKYAIGAKDAIVCFLSGGGSAMLAAPVSGVSLDDKQAVIDLLYRKGADSVEISTVRKHLSLIKGGRLAQFFAPAKVISLIISDVTSEREDIIASGPTVVDQTVFRDAYYVLDKYNLLTKVPASILGYFKKGIAGRTEDTAKFLKNAFNYTIGTNRDLLEGVALEARRIGLRPLVVKTGIKGDASVEAANIVKCITDKKFQEYNVLIFGGAPFSAIPKNYGPGDGCLRLAAVCLSLLKDHQGEWALAAVSSNGSDHTRHAGGALFDHKTLFGVVGQKIKIDEYLQDSDPIGLFRKVGHSLIKMHGTNANVGDLLIFLRK